MSFSIATLVHSQNFKKPNTNCSIAQKITVIIDGVLVISLVVIVALAVLDQSGIYSGLLKGIGSIGPGVWGFGSAIVLIAIADVSTMICWKKIKVKKENKAIEDPATAPPQAKMTSTTEKVSKKAAILFVSISGHPPHYGHLALGDTAAQEIRKEYKDVTILFSLCPQNYLKQKMQGKAGSIPTFENRQQQLELLLTEAKTHGMFQGVRAQFWNDQEKEDSDHPDSYRRLTEHYRDQADVFMVGGTDLCRRMGAAWFFMKHKVVVTRGQGDPDTTKVTNSLGEIVSFNDTATNQPFVKALKDKNQSTILLQNAYPQFEEFSSTAIRENKIKNEFPGFVKV